MGEGGVGMGPDSKQLIRWHLTLICRGSSLLCVSHCLGGGKGPLRTIISLLVEAASLCPVYFLWASNLASSCRELSKILQSSAPSTSLTGSHCASVQTHLA